MRYFRHTLIGMMLALMASLLWASNDAPKARVDYTLVQSPAPVSGDRVQVTEFFGYFCPHCFKLDPYLNGFAKSQGSKIDFKRLHILFGNNQLAAQQRMFFTVQALKDMKAVRDNPALTKSVDGLHEKIFAAIHVERNPLLTEQQIVDFMGKQGISKALWEQASASFDVDRNVRLANDLAKSYNIDGVPTIIVEGKYMTSPATVAAGLGPNQSEVALDEATVKVLNFLVAKAEAERKPAAKAKTEKASEKHKPAAKDEKAAEEQKNGAKAK